MTKDQILQSCRKLVDEYLEHGVNFSDHIPRLAYDINLVMVYAKKPIEKINICDIGGGYSLFIAVLASMGAEQAILVDDFMDYEASDTERKILELHQLNGVKIIKRDVVKEGIEDLPCLNVITSFASMEHWHQSPKNLFHSIKGKLDTGGLFLLNGPNCVNLRKRITVPLGFGKWTSMNDWYESEFFRGHVREPDVDDLKYIGRDMELTNIKIHGANWLGYYSRFKFARIGTYIMDRPLRLLPTLCSDIYMTGLKM
jgi:hypothetical protein